MSGNRNSEWDDDEVVPVDLLRPDPKSFGPLPAAKKGKPKKASNHSTPSKSSREIAQRNGAARSNAANPSQKLGQARTIEPRQRVEAEIDLRDNRVNRDIARSGGSKRPSARPEQQLEKQRSDKRPKKGSRASDSGPFVNKLAADDRTPVVLKPSSGWRGILLKMSGGIINVGPSASERLELGFRQQARRTVTDGTVAVFSRKGGVGKTTISAYLGLTLAEERGGRIVALDGDAEAGSLGWLLAPRAPSTLAALASADPIPTDYAGLRRFTAATASGLEVIVGDPAEMGPISTIGLEAVANQLSRHYDVSIFDTGAGVTRATGRVLVNSARVLLLVMGPSVDSVRAAERTLAWLDERPGEAANPNAQVVAVINGIPATTKDSHVEKIESHFSGRCSAVVRIPWDAHLAAGSSSVSLDHLAKPTRRAFLELAATTVSTLAKPVRRTAMAGTR